MCSQTEMVSYTFQISSYPGVYNRPTSLVNDFSLCRDFFRLVGEFPAMNLACLTSTRPCSRLRAEINFHMLGWWHPTVALKLRCHASTALVVLGRPRGVS